MAAQKAQVAQLWREKPKRKRKGIHSKTKSSKSSTSTNYKKPYKSQGR